MKSLLKKKQSIETDGTNDLNNQEECKEEKDNLEMNQASVVLSERYLLNKENEEQEALSNVLDQMQSFSIEWKSLRGILQCSCGSPIDYLTRKVSLFQQF